MTNYPIIARLLCVGVVAAVMLPLGSFVFPHIAASMDSLQFETIEAVLSATIGFGLYSLLFG